MHITAIELFQFRCFSHIQISLDSPLVLITGNNGSGKTSLLEALHVGCYVRSFRSSSLSELSMAGTHSFLLRITFVNEDEGASAQILSVAYADKKKVVKINNVPVRSFKDLFSHYRIVTIFEDDLLLIKGSPSERRHFLDNALSLLKNEYVRMLKLFRKNLDNRNALLHDGSYARDETFPIWTQHLWQSSRDIALLRQDFLHKLEHRVTLLLQTHIDATMHATFTYKGLAQGSWEEFSLHILPRLMVQEAYQKRSLFGAHLDDFDITFNGKGARSFSSRGQQKLLLMLIKIAFIELLHDDAKKCIVLIDDFMADFDPNIGLRMLNILCSLGIQLIFTAPSAHGVIEQTLLNRHGKHIILG